jgi:hypothetical protein
MPVILKMDKLLEIERKFPGAVDGVLGKIAGDTEGEVKRLMTGPKSGKMYGTHQASAPGEAPAVDISALINTVVHRKVGKHLWKVFAGGASAGYAARLEFGSARVRARPFMRPAVMTVANRIPRKLLVSAVGG